MQNGLVFSSTFVHLNCRDFRLVVALRIITGFILRFSLRAGHALNVYYHGTQWFSFASVRATIILAITSSRVSNSTDQPLQVIDFQYEVKSVKVFLVSFQIIFEIWGYYWNHRFRLSFYYQVKINSTFLLYNSFWINFRKSLKLRKKCYLIYSISAKRMYIHKSHTMLLLIIGFLKYQNFGNVKNVKTVRKFT